MNLGSPLWTKMGTRGNQWKYGNVYITPQTLSPPQQGPTTVNVSIAHLSQHMRKGYVPHRQPAKVQVCLCCSQSNRDLRKFHVKNACL